jgi:hypothetical protein
MARRTTPNRERWPPAKTKLAALIDEAIVDAYGESEQRTAFYTLLDQHLETPFDTKVLGVTVTVERIDMTDDEQIIAICRRGRSLQAIPILDLPVRKPRPAGVDRWPLPITTSQGFFATTLPFSQTKSGVPYMRAVFCASFAARRKARPNSRRKAQRSVRLATDGPGGRWLTTKIGRPPWSPPQ